MNISSLANSGLFSFTEKQGGEPMGRTIKKQFWLNSKEAEALRRNAEKTCLTETALVRLLITGFEPREKPDAAFYQDMNQLSAIGNNLNQIAARLNRSGAVDSTQLKEEIEKLKAFRLALLKKYVEPDEAQWL